jgi:hypothetical protein
MIALPRSQRVRGTHKEAIMRREPAQKTIGIAGFAATIALMLGVGIPAALFHKSPDPVYYLGITLVYIAAVFGLVGLLFLTMKLIRRIAASKRFRDHGGSAYHASVKLTVRFWSESDNKQASVT